MQVFLVQRGNKGGVDPVGKFMGDVVGLALYLLDSCRMHAKIGEVIDQGLKFLGRIHSGLRLFF